ncbi:MAG: histidine phosphatase family protein [Chloroflexota bacterium]|nr:histidine phosphatase family protein [Chloroflexota bacterium]
MTRARILLIRHGQTDWNNDGRWQGQLDIPLNDVGLEQAAALAAHLQGRPIRAVHTSDLARAQRTAAVIAAALALPLSVDARWREMNLGVFQGLTGEQIEVKYPEEFNATRTDYLNHVIPEGESRRMMQDRSQVALDEILASFSAEADSEVAVFSHGGTIKALLIRLFPDNADIRGTSIPNTSITTLEYTADGGWRLIEMGLTPHLPSDLSEDIYKAGYIPKESAPPSADGA